MLPSTMTVSVLKSGLRPRWMGLSVRVRLCLSHYCSEDKFCATHTHKVAFTETRWFKMAWTELIDNKGRRGTITHRAAGFWENVTKKMSWLKPWKRQHILYTFESRKITGHICLLRNAHDLFLKQRLSPCQRKHGQNIATLFLMALGYWRAFQVAVVKMCSRHLLVGVGLFI